MSAKFRYASPWEKFEDAVREVKDLLKKKDAYWAVGFLDEFDLFIDNTAAEKMKEETLDIIYDEILYLLKWRLDEKIVNEEDIRTALFSTDYEISEEELELMAKVICNKYEFVVDAFDVDNLAMRYNLKRNTVSPKLSDLEYDVSTQYMPDGHMINCALVNMVCKKKLNETAGQSGDITFICDEGDIDLWIDQLREMKQKIRECKNGNSTK